MNQLMTYTYPSTTIEEDSTSILLDTGKIESQNELNIRTASLEDLRSLIVTKMMTTVKKDLKVINLEAKPSGNKK